VTALGVCDACAGTKRLRGDGTIPTHYLTIPVSARAVHQLGARRVWRRCPGSRRPPRRSEP